MGIRDRLVRRLRRRLSGQEFREPYPRGHFYSPLPDLAEIERRKGSLFDRTADDLPGIDLRVEHQLALFERVASAAAHFSPNARPLPPRLFHLDQNFFGIGDALVLFGLVHVLQPSRIIEVGSGYTSALILDTVGELDIPVDLTFIDPKPARLRSLVGDGPGRARIVDRRVEECGLDFFAELDAGDFLFLDSSHVGRIGGDVNFLLFDVLPRLRSGVIVHVHDIFWPFEYPHEWLKSGRAWNETYLVRALLIFSSGFEILLYNSFLGHRHAELVGQLLPGFLDNPGGSLWLRRR